MDIEVLFADFIGINDFFFTRSLKPHKRGILFSQKEIEELNSLIEIFEMNYGGPTGYWGVISLLFSNIPGYELYNYFLSQENYVSTNYYRYNHKLRLIHDIKLMDKEKIIEIINQFVIKHEEHLRYYYIMKVKPSKPGTIWNPARICPIIVAIQFISRIKPLMRACLELKNSFKLESSSLANQLLMISEKLLTFNETIYINNFLEFIHGCVREDDDPILFIIRFIDDIFFEFQEMKCDHYFENLFYMGNGTLNYAIVVPRQNYPQMIAKEIENIKSNPKFILISIDNLENNDFPVDISIIPLEINQNKYTVVGLIIFRSNHNSIIYIDNNNLYEYSDDLIIECKFGLNDETLSKKIVGIILIQDKNDIVLNRIRDSSTYEEIINYKEESNSNIPEDFLYDDPLTDPLTEDEQDTVNLLNEEPKEISEIADKTNERTTVPDNISKESSSHQEEVGTVLKQNNNKENHCSFDQLQSIIESNNCVSTSNVSNDSMINVIYSLVTNSEIKKHIIIVTIEESFKYFISIIEKFRGTIFLLDQNVKIYSHLMVMTLKDVIETVRKIGKERQILIFFTEKTEKLSPGIIEIIESLITESLIQLLVVNYEIGDHFNNSFINVELLDEEKQEFYKDIDQDQEELILKPNMIWSSYEEAFDYIGKFGLQNGIRFAHIDSFNSAYKYNHMRIYCTSKNEANVKCPCSLKLTSKTKNYKFVAVELTSYKEQHNHVLNSENTNFLLMSVDKLKILKSLRRARVPVFSIIRIFKEWYDTNLVYRQIITLERYYSDNKIDSLQSLELSNYMKDKDGLFFIKFDTKNGIKVTEAVLTFEKFELSNLERSYVISIDGTNFPNTMNWELVPITTKDNNSTIQSCGALFARTLNKDIVLWTFEKLFSLSQSSNIITVISDEDSAVVYAIPIWNKSNNKILHHILCRFHKIRNFLIRLKAIVKNQEDYDEIKQHLRRMMSTRFEEVAFKKILEIKSFGYSEIDQYIENNILNNEEKLLVSKMDTLTLGNYTTSNSESSNSLVKRAHHKETLKSMREEITWWFLQKNRNFEYAESRKRPRIYPIQQKFNMKGPERIIKLLQFSFDKALRLIEKKPSNAVENSNESQIIYFDPLEKEDVEEVIVSKANLTCQCRRVIVEGLPCSHLIRCCISMDIDPWVLIHPFYGVTYDSSAKFSPDLEHNHDDITFSADTISEVNSSADTNSVSDTSSAKNELLHIVKDLINIIDGDESLLEETKLILANQMNKCMEKKKDEIVDFQTKKKRGRPKYLRLKSRTEDH